MGDVKSASHKKLLEIYKEKGFAVTMAIARRILEKNVSSMLNGKSDSFKKSFRTSVNGEVGETVLEICIIEYCKRHPTETKDWYYTKSMILKDPDNPNSDFLTELDFTLFTPECIYLFECKSYAGDKHLTGRGVLKRSNGNDCDVFSQSYLHIQILDKNVKGFSANPVYKMVMFDFSSGIMHDERDSKAKYYLACVDETSWKSVLMKKAPKVWRMEKLIPAVKKIYAASDSLREAHLKYVKSLRRD